MTVPRLRALLELDLPPFHVRLHEKELQQLEQSTTRYLLNQDRILGETGAGIGLGERLIAFYQSYIDQTVQDRSAIDFKFTNFRRGYAHAVTEQERRELILGLALALGAGKQALAGDRRAFNRWFGYDAVSERYQRRVSADDRILAFTLGRLGSVAAFVLREAADHGDPLQVWRRIDLERVVRPLFTFVGSTSVRIASFRCLSTALRALPGASRASNLSDRSLTYIYRTALDTTQETWLQCEALSLLGSLSTESLDKALVVRIEKAGSEDDLFVRRHAVRLLGTRLEFNPRLALLLTAAAADPSPGVRQIVAEILPKARGGGMGVLPVLIGADNDPPVRASAVLAIAGLCSRPELFKAAVNQLLDVLEREADRFVLRVALETVVSGYTGLTNRPELAQAWLQTLLPAVARLHVGSEHLAVRRWAAQVRERLWGQTVPEAKALIEWLAPLLERSVQGRSQNLWRWRLRNQDQETLGRTLALLAQRDFGFDLEQRMLGSRITRGNRFGFRMWRFLHELRNPETDKRQAFSHTTGRLFRGTVRAASAITSELAQTKVPGEPLFIATEEGWRPYLPLVDEMISVLDQPLSSGPLRLYTSEGVTEVVPPASIWRRLRARLSLTLKFSHYARLRNWQEGSSQPSGTYVSALKVLGFSLSIRPHAAHTAIPTTLDPAVVRFFPAGFALPGMATVQDIQDYFFSVYENSLPELALFITLAMLLFLGRHIWVSRRIRRIRKRIPLSIGGWGTRGKSGTERLKAALFNALGHTVVSKTTGCEAMFLYGPANGNLREMFLFRPYDKATIWEQADVIDIATRLDVDVFLWECMGLTPAYVAILQQQWMRDDMATITNTYPDHEDLQGPAGINIPQVMNNFIPRRATLITSEEQMLPILADGTKAQGTQLRSVGWLEAGLLTADLLDRFPYAEHPYNIALVIRMAEELGVDPDFALKEMADRVVPDLGVLKASPVAKVRGRRLEFVNGMSANERYGCLGNWERMGFAGHDPYADAGIWLTTVVNNRADRVPRSRVFASILVKDIGAERHLIIGTNLDGFISYVREAWDDYSADVTLIDKTGARTPLKALEETARKFRIPYRRRHVQRHLDAMLAGLEIWEDLQPSPDLWSRPEELRNAVAPHLDQKTVQQLLDHVQGVARSYMEYEQLAQQIAAAPVSRELDEIFRRQLWRWFERKLEVIEDPHASGNWIINRIIALSPPGLLTRIMGIQNIKGTGLDFVYRWQAWEICCKACQAICGEDRDLAARGLQVLAQFQDYNALCEEKVRTSVETARHLRLAQNEWFQSELTIILSNLDKAMEQLKTHLELSSKRNRASLFARLLAQIEAFLDAGDAIKRRKRANLIYQELAAARISHERAALELQALNTRQKGGWLQHKLESLLHNVQ